MRDPYNVLGVDKSASTGDIKSAYRRLAKKFHPDQNKTDIRAKERFAEVSAAYDIIGDKEKRRRFDRGEIDADGNPRFAGAFNSDSGGFRFRSGDAGSERVWRTASSGNVDDILREFMSGFGGGERRNQSRAWSQATARGEDLEVDVTLTLEDVAADEKVRVSLPNGKTVDLKIPRGVENGQQVRLRGQGDASPTGSLAGDAIMTLQIAPHPLFRRDGADLHLDLPVTLYDAVLGARVKVPTLEGSVMLTVPPGSSGGKRLRLRGKGLPSKLPGSGDLIVTLRIALPTANDPRLTELMERWRRDRPYDPAAASRD